MPTLTEEQRQKYLADSSICPFCGESDRYISNPCSDVDTIYQGVTCGKCREFWVEVFTRSGVISSQEFGNLIDAQRNEAARCQS